jgi:Delta7-sterol 5-desaturase
MSAASERVGRSEAIAARARRIAVICGLGLVACAALTPWLSLEIPAEVASASVLGWVAAHGGLLGLVVFQIVVALALGAVLSGGSFLFFFVRHRERFNPGYRRDTRAILGSCTWAALGISGGTLLAAPMQLAVFSGYSRAYFRIEEHGWGYLAVSMLLLLVFTETAVYWTHRALHHPALFRRTHVYHHQFREPTPWAAFAFHPFDAFAQAFPYHVAAFIFPLHVGVYTIAMSLVMLWSVSIHDRVSLLPFRWLLYAGHHTLHHIHNRYNLGQYFTIWDRLAGTYRCPSTLPDAYRAGRPDRGGPA